MVKQLEECQSLRSSNCTLAGWLKLTPKLYVKGTTSEQVWDAGKLYESPFHPASGELLWQNVFPIGSFRGVPAVVFWQRVNKSFNALVGYTNRNAKSEVSSAKLGVAYVSATTSTRKFLTTWYNVPFAAVAAANCINIPFMRQPELINGIFVYDENGNTVTESHVVATKGITQDVISQIVMTAPGISLLPLVMEILESYSWMQRTIFFHMLLSKYPPVEHSRCLPKHEVECQSSLNDNEDEEEKYMMAEASAMLVTIITVDMVTTTPASD
ncbi:hypothetical protein GHT06_010521 [Daphnia sinensis]|uniref:Uncharacterized protein n=1 Tax=Daphnia sinensis TaxID=1820382 RepID=A0AAD5L0M1_9CRUS|nr:hypothetical protein GHT06_010521 [Daphnia sinensis]